jgi:DNA-binding NarL/FixJ family response regulator
MRHYPIAADALFGLSYHATIAGEYSRSLQCIGTLVDLPPDPAQFKANLSLAHYSFAFGSDTELSRLLAEAEDINFPIHIRDFWFFISLRAIADARMGKMSESRSAFDVAIQAKGQKEADDQLVGFLSMAAEHAVNFGAIQRSRTLYQKAIAMSLRMPFSIQRAYALLSYAWTSLHLGHFSEARRLFEEADLRPDNALTNRILRAAVGVMLGSLTQDSRLIERSLDLGVLDLMMRSDNVARGGKVIAAVHEHYRAIGRVDAARELMAAATRKLRTPHGCWWLLLQVAASGSNEDCLRVLRILAAYPPAFRLVSALRLTIEARLTKTDSAEIARQKNAEAATIFESLEWRYFQAQCLEQAGSNSEAGRMFLEMGFVRNRQIVPRGRRPARRSTILTIPEFEIATLVGRGATNRQIADRLGMAERSVKYHLTAIFNALGISNRFELADVVNRRPQVLRQGMRIMDDSGEHGI